MTTPSVTDSPPHVDTWRRWGRAAGYIAAPVFLIQTVLFLLDVTGVLAPQTAFIDTPAGVMEDLATYYVAANERMHTIWWDAALRDTLGPIGYVALMVLVIAVVRVSATHHRGTRSLSSWSSSGGARRAQRSDIPQLYPVVVPRRFPANA